MGSYNPRDNRNPSLKLMGRRLGASYAPQHPKDTKLNGQLLDGKEISVKSITDPSVVGVENQRSLLEINGGILQQERMIFDKRRSLDRAVLYSYQAALVKNVKAGENEHPMRALINPDKNKLDYDDKIISVGYEYGMRAGDVFEWLGTNTYWLIYLQDIDELAYFRGEIRRCSYTIEWKDEDDNVYSTYAAVRGPVETKINFIQKKNISVDEPNHSLHIYMPRTKEALEYFRRYSKFYLQGEDEGSPLICWRVEATDWISTPNILEITAVEYYSNKDEDDYDEKLVKGLVAKPINPNTEEVEEAIIGETFIKPLTTYTYEYKGPSLPSSTQWRFDRKYPVELEKLSATKFTLKWLSNYSGQMIVSYGDYTKTIVVESLF